METEALAKMGYESKYLESAWIVKAEVRAEA